jgi:hypothetical protein
VLNQSLLNIRFNRVLVGDKWDAWVHLVSRLTTVQLSDTFSVKSMYADMMSGHTVFLKKYLWKIKIPLKIRILCGSFIERWS